MYMHIYMYIYVYAHAHTYPYIYIYRPNLFQPVCELLHLLQPRRLRRLRLRRRRAARRLGRHARPLGRAKLTAQRAHLQRRLLVTDGLRTYICKAGEARMATDIVSRLLGRVNRRLGYGAWMFL